MERNRRYNKPSWDIPYKTSNHKNQTNLEEFEPKEQEKDGDRLKQLKEQKDFYERFINDYDVRIKRLRLSIKMYQKKLDVIEDEIRTYNRGKEKSN